MKYFLSLFILCYLSSCVSYKPLTQSNVKAVYILFKDSSWGDHYKGYKLYDGSIVRWGKHHVDVKAALNNYKNKIEELPKEGSNYLAHFFSNKKTAKRMAIKVIPLTEFGLVETNSNEFIFYGVEGETGFIDLTHDRVYH